MSKKYILASQSPRRKELLALLEVDYKVISSDVIETIDSNLKDYEIVMDLAKQKAEDIATKHPNEVVLGFDTIVVKDHHILGKPKDDNDSRRMLKLLSNTNHQVLTGVAIIYKEEMHLFYSETNVFFKELSEEEISDYIKTTEPNDKAGAYGIQGFGAKFVSKIEGDYYTVMGLPVHMLYQKLKEFEML